MCAGLGSSPYGVPGRHHGLWGPLQLAWHRPRSDFWVDPLRTVALGKPLTSQGCVIKGKTKALLRGPGEDRRK